MDKKSRVTLSLADKIRILDRLKNGEKKETIMKETKIALRTLQRIVKSEDEIRKNSTAMPSARKRNRTGQHENVDEALEKWFSSARNQKVIVMGSQLIKKAKEFANEFGLVNYVLSNGLFCRWKKRLGIKFKKTHGEKNSANTEAAESWIENRMP